MNLRPVVVMAILTMCVSVACADDEGLRLAYKNEYLTLSSDTLPGHEIKIHYIEAYCRSGSTNQSWDKTTIGHTTRVLSADPDGKHLTLESVLRDGVVVRHEVRAARDEVSFDITAKNPTEKASDAQWAQPCVRFDAFTGRDKDTYLDKCFIFLNGKLTRMPTPTWATEALYTPGQVWRGQNVDAKDINPRPLNRDLPSSGLIGCYSADETKIAAVVFEPHQELFQGVAACLHSDFRIGGLKPGESKTIRGKIYIVPANVDALVARYHKDFPDR